MNGGYLIVSLQNHDFVVDGGRVYVKDIYKTIANSNYKAVMLCDITLNGERKQNVYSVIERRDNTIILYAYGYAITITDTDTIEITDNIVTNIRYYESIDDVPLDLSEGSFVAVPSTGGGGLPVVELTTLLTDENGQVALTASESTVLSAAFETGSPIIVKCNITHTVGFQMANAAMLTSRGIVGGMAAFSFSIGSIVFQLVRYDGTNWAFLETVWEV